MPAMWRAASVSVIFPTYNERDSIHDAIGEFLATGHVDEVVVVNNNAAPGTDEEVRRHRRARARSTSPARATATPSGAASARPPATC